MDQNRMKKNGSQDPVFFHPNMNHIYAIFQKNSNMNVPKFACNLSANFGTFWSCVSFKLSPHGSVPGLFFQDPVQALVGTATSWLVLGPWCDQARW